MEYNGNVCEDLKLLKAEEKYLNSEQKVYWCENCNIPTYYDFCPICDGKTRYLCQDARPVFPEEILLLEILLNIRGRLVGKSIWNAKGNRYYVNGKRLAFSVKNILREWDPKRVRVLLQQEKIKDLDLGYDEFNDMINLFIKANKERLHKLEEDSFRCVKFAVDNYPNRIVMVSFSGGKDSTVVSSVVRRALGTNNVLHVFGDTTLEFPATKEYVKYFRKKNRRIPFLTARVPSDKLDEEDGEKFLQLCNIIGPPSRIMRWCCTTFKTAPISSLIDKFSGNKSILTFYGIRSSESVRRSKYKEISISPKISKQIVASPIMDWLDLDVWLYLLSNKEEFNDAYRQGFSRVGCWCCPSNSDWAYFLSQIYLDEKADEWRDFLIDFARRIGKPDPEVYVDSGNWKARQGGDGMNVNFNNVKFEPCANEENARNYFLSKPISGQLYEYFKPFGIVNFSLGRKLLNEVYILDRNTKEPLLILQGREGASQLKVIIVRDYNLNLLLNRIDCQIRKYQACINCGGCPAICKKKAIAIIGDHYKIDQKKCVGCMDCIAHYDRGCLVAKVTQVRSGS
jgi:phosphoadenosine phosphosulfate reductase